MFHVKQALALFLGAVRRSSTRHHRAWPGDPVRAKWRAHHV